MSLSTDTTFISLPNYLKSAKMIREIDAEEFVFITSDDEKIDYLDEFGKNGFSVYKDKTADKYYVYIDGYNFKIDGKAAFDDFIVDHKKYTKHPKTFVVQSIFHGQNPDKKQFPSTTTQRIDKLSKVVGATLLRNGKPDENSLKAVDSFLNRQTDPFAVRKKYFMDMVALLGETLIQKFGNRCHWVMELSKDGVTWEPDVFYDQDWLSIGTTLYDSLRDATNKEPLDFTFDVLDLIIHANLGGGTEDHD